MTGRPAWGPWAPPLELRRLLFDRVQHGGGERCWVCGRTGQGAGRWQWDCCLFPDHPFRCSCGARYPSPAAIAAHIRARDRWHPNEVHRRVAPTLGAEPVACGPQVLLS